MEKLVPKLRFPEFEGNWDKIQLGKFSEINPKNGILPDRFIYIDLESVNNGILEQENLISKEGAPSRAQRILQKEDILYQTVRPYQKNNLYFDKKSGNYIASTGYAQLRTKNSSKFLYQLLHTDKFVTKVLLRCTGTSYPSINSSDLSEIIISYPQPEEQQKIASFLTSVDERLTLLAQQKEKLELYKKGVMQQIFSQKLRFKDENGNNYPDWEEKKLGKLCEYKNGGSFESQVDENGFYNLISLNSIDINGKLKSEHKKVKLTDNSLKKGDLVMVLSDVAHGYFLGLTDVIPDDNYVLNQRMGALKPIVEINNYFLKTFINFNQKYFKLMGQGSSQQNLSKGDIVNFKIDLPCLEEQQKIAWFLSAIDVQIEGVSKKIAQTKLFKKGLLQQMFV